jgi:hypothetical protein
LLGVTLLKSVPRWVRLEPLVLIAGAGGVLTVWAMEPARWWDALEFRGPTTLVSLTAAGFALADALLAQVTGSARLKIIPDIRRHAGQAIAVTFAIILSVQAIAFGTVIDDMNDTLAASDARCIPISNLPGMPESPLNLWSTPSHSLLYQGWSPSQIVQMDGDCERAEQNGSLSISGPASSYVSDRMDLVPLQWELGGHGACWWDEPGGWHIAEVTEIGRRRWSADTGTLRLFVGEPTAVSFTGTMVSFTPDNIVEIIVNGQVQKSVVFGEEREQPMETISLDLRQGENVIEFVSVNDAGRAPGDPRDLAFSLLNVEPVLATEEPCTYRA